ncbi:hypothetical protein LZ30DRAFT_441064 [Colletotrichum cereale]|nr:hypothetical protein LZ30DRAFT_441064 [Colletotrichum cereale]
MHITAFRTYPTPPSKQTQAKGLGPPAHCNLHRNPTQHLRLPLSVTSPAHPTFLPPLASLESLPRRRMCLASPAASDLLPQALLRDPSATSKPNRWVYPARIAAMPFSRVCDCLSCPLDGHSKPLDLHGSQLGHQAVQTLRKQAPQVQPASLVAWASSIEIAQRGKAGKPSLFSLPSTHMIQMAPTERFRSLPALPLLSRLLRLDVCGGRWLCVPRVDGASDWPRLATSRTLNVKPIVAAPSGLRLVQRGLGPTVAFRLCSR